MNGLSGVPRRAHTGSGRPRRANYNLDFDSVDPTGAVGQAPMTGGVFKNAAFEVLKQEERLMTSGEITKLAMERKLLKCTGKTPENTMASALYTEVRKKATTTVFIKPKEGLFGLKAWLAEPWLLSWLAQEGIDPADLLDPGGAVAAEPASKRLRTSYSGAAASRGASGTGYYGTAGHRTSSNGLAAAPLSAAQRAALSEFGLPHQAGGGGGGAVGGHRRVAYGESGTAAVASGGLRVSVNGGGGSGGVGQRQVYDAAAAAVRGATGGGAVAAAAGGAAPGSGGASDTVSSLHLLLDAADEIEAGPEDEHAALPRVLSTGRGGGGAGDDVERQSSFRRQPPHGQRAPLSREPSMPSLTTRRRVHDDIGDAEEDEEEVLPDEAFRQRAVLPVRQGPPVYHPHFLQQQPQQQRPLQQQQQRRPQQHWQRPQSSRPSHARGAAVYSEEEDGMEEEELDPYTNEDAEAPAQMAYSRRWGPGVGEGEDEDSYYHHRQPAGYRSGRSAAVAQLEAPVSQARPRPRAADLPPHLAPRSHRMEAVLGGSYMDRAAPGVPPYTDQEEEMEDSGEDDTDRAALVRQRWRAGLQRGDRTGAGGFADAAARMPASSAGTRRAVAAMQVANGLLAPSQPRGLAAVSGGSDEDHPPPAARVVQRGIADGGKPSRGVALLPRGASTSSCAGVAAAAAAGAETGAQGARGGGGGSSPAEGGREQLPSTEEVVEQLRAVLASNGALAGGTLGLGFGGALGKLPGLPQGLGALAGLSGLDVGVLLGSLVAGSPLGSTSQVAAALRSSLQPLGGQGRQRGGAGGEGAAVRVSQDSAAEEGGVDGMKEETMEHACGPQLAGLGGGGDGQGDACGAVEAAAEKAAAAAVQQETSPRDGYVHGKDGEPRSWLPSSMNAAEIAPKPSCGIQAPLGAAMAAAAGSALTSASGPSSGAPAAVSHATGSVLQPAPVPVQRPPPHAPAASTSVAIHDAMNSPDSHTAGADRTTPEAEEAAHDCKQQQQQVLPPPQQQQHQLRHNSGETVQCNGGGGVARDQPRAGPGPSRPGPYGQDDGKGAQQQQQLPVQMVPMALLAQLQQQHLDLLPLVEAARAGDVPDPDAINRIRQQVLDVQSRMGSLHPETGRAYVLLARVLEHKGTCWSLNMAERALLRAWTIVGLVSKSRRPSESGAGAAAVAGVAAAAAAEAGEEGASEMLGQLPDSFHTFQYLLEQIRMKHSYLQLQQQQQLLAVLQTVAAASAAGSSGLAPVTAEDGTGSAGAAAGGNAAGLGAALSGLPQLLQQLPSGSLQQVQHAALQQLLHKSQQQQQKQQLKQSGAVAGQAGAAARRQGGGVMQDAEEPQPDSPRQP